jgi:hypothetical protein
MIEHINKYISGECLAEGSSARGANCSVLNATLDGTWDISVENCDDIHKSVCIQQKQRSF